MVPVGVIGLSSAWETRYRPALRSLRHRIAVRAIYDPVLSRAELAASEFGALPIAGMKAVARREDLKALLVFDTGWYGPEAIRLLCLTGRPIFLGGDFTADETTLARLAEAAVESGTMVMPALGPRYTPATSRLRELMASRLGRPIRIEIQADVPEVSTHGASDGSRTWEDFVARMADWCCYVVPTPPTDVRTVVSRSNQLNQIRMMFAQPRAGGELPSVSMRLSTRANGEYGAAVGPVYHVRCERGEATLDAVDRIAWRTDRESVKEALVSDRPEMQVMLDHFCRRVVGGLIPVADLEDVRRSRRLARAAAESLRTGASIRL